jgi:hypothetical protein
MNKDIISAEEMLKLFDLFIDQAMVDKGVIEFEDYTESFREVYGADKNSPMEFMFRGFIGGLFMASVDLDMIE